MHDRQCRLADRRPDRVGLQILQPLRGRRPRSGPDRCRVRTRDEQDDRHRGVPVCYGTQRRSATHRSTAARRPTGRRDRADARHRRRDRHRARGRQIVYQGPNAGSGGYRHLQRDRQRRPSHRSSRPRGASASANSDPGPVPPKTRSSRRQRPKDRPCSMPAGDLGSEDCGIQRPLRGRPGRSAVRHGRRRHLLAVAFDRHDLIGGAVDDRNGGRWRRRAASPSSSRCPPTRPMPRPAST